MKAAIFRLQLTYILINLLIEYICMYMRVKTRIPDFYLKQDKTESFFFIVRVYVQQRSLLLAHSALVSVATVVFYHYVCPGKTFWISPGISPSEIMKRFIFNMTALKYIHVYPKSRLNSHIMSYF